MNRLRATAERSTSLLDKVSANEKLASAKWRAGFLCSAEETYREAFGLVKAALRTRNMEEEGEEHDDAFFVLEQIQFGFYVLNRIDESLQVGTLIKRAKVDRDSTFTFPDLSYFMGGNVGDALDNALRMKDKRFRSLAMRSIGQELAQREGLLAVRELVGTLPTRLDRANLLLGAAQRLLWKG